MLLIARVTLTTAALIAVIQVVGQRLHPAFGHARAHEGEATHIREILRDAAFFAGFTGGDPMRHLDQRALGIAVEQQIGLGIEQDRAAHLVGPVIVMRDAAQAGLDAADHNWACRIRLAAALGIDDDSAIRPRATAAAGGVAVIMAKTAIRSVAVHHRIHVAAGDAEEKIRLAQRLEWLGALPIGLRDDADAEALRLQQPPDDRHAEARVINIGIAGDKDDVATVPSQRIHLGAGHRQEGGGTKALRPVFLVAEQRPCLRQTAQVGRRRQLGLRGIGRIGAVERGHGQHRVRASRRTKNIG